MRAAAEAAGLDAAAVWDLVIAVDEACQNIIRHAYGGDGRGDIVIAMARRRGRIVVRVRDFAEPVRPETIRPRDLHELRPGGLGTHFIRSLMDAVRFEAPPRGGRGNVLRMEKRIG